ncbi:MAG: hypothetical protein J6Z12_06955, partial [Paludibacteraceae bacterium]|nr:hypothetical protein [Paludibacteraceae bacterium]
MKKYLILILSTACYLAAWAYDPQIKDGSQAQEWNTYDNGGKTIVYPIYSEYGTEDTPKEDVVLPASPGNSSTVPFIRWYRVNTNLNKDKAPSHSFSTANNANDLVTYRASTWINSTNSNNTPDNLNKVAYTEVFNTEGKNSNNAPTASHTLVVPSGAEFHLRPQYYYRTNNYIWNHNYKSGWIWSTEDHTQYCHPSTWTYTIGNTPEEGNKCSYTGNATANQKYTLQGNYTYTNSNFALLGYTTYTANASPEIESWTLTRQMSFPSESRLSDYLLIYENEFDDYFEADPANSSRSTKG